MSSNGKYKQNNYRIVVVDPEESNAYLCKHLEREGNEVVLMSAQINHGTNLYNKIHSPDQILEFNPDFCLFTRPGLGKMAYDVYAQGIKTVAGGLIQDQFADYDYIRRLCDRLQIPSRYKTEEDVKERRGVTIAGLFSKVGFCGPALRYDYEQCMYPNTLSPGIFLKAEEPDSYFTQVMYRLQKATAAVDFCGWLFVEVDIETREVIYVSPHTPPGFWSAFCRGLEQPLGWMLSSLAVLEKKKRFRFKFTEEFTGSVKVSIPPHLPGLRLNQAVAETSDLLEVNAVEGYYHSYGANVGWVSAQSGIDLDDLLQELPVISRMLLEPPSFSEDLCSNLRVTIEEEVSVDG